MMERSNKDKPLWRKITTGKLYPFSKQRSRRVKPKETIRCAFEDIAHVIDHFELVENGKGKFKVDEKNLVPEEQQPVDVPEKEEYSVESAGAGWYNVLSPAGKVMNDKKLRVEDAETLKASLEEETEQA